MAFTVIYLGSLYPSSPPGPGLHDAPVAQNHAAHLGRRCWAAVSWRGGRTGCSLRDTNRHVRNRPPVSHCSLRRCHEVVTGDSQEIMYVCVNIQRFFLKVLVLSPSYEKHNCRHKATHNIVFNDSSQVFQQSHRCLSALNQCLPGVKLTFKPNISRLSRPNPADVVFVRQIIRGAQWSSTACRKRWI